MTREENTAKLAQLKSEVEGLVKTYNDAIQNGRFEESTKADGAMAEKINEYTATVRDMCFEDCKATDDPMLTAVKTLSYVTIGVKDEKKGDDKVPVRTVVDKERAIDLLKLDKYCGGIGHDKEWMHIAQKMNFLLTCQKARDLGLDPQKVNAMLGDGYKATSHDVNFLLSVYSRKNRKALVVSCANHRNFRGYIAEVCHRIVTGKEYELEYKTKREG